MLKEVTYATFRGAEKSEDISKKLSRVVMERQKVASMKKYEKIEASNDKAVDVSRFC